MSELKTRAPILDFIFVPRSANFTPLIYLQLITVAEILTTLREQAISIGLVMHSIILCTLLIHGALENNIRNRRIYLTISLAPLMRVLSLTLPLAMAGLSLQWWYFWIGLLVYVGMFVTAIVTRIPAQRVGLRLGKLHIQLLIGLIGIPFGLLEYFILRPSPLTESMDIKVMLLPMLILVIFTGVLEEALFRGLIQQSLISVYGRFGITYSAILFSVLHIGYRSILDVFFVFGVAIVFGIFTHRTDSILGVSMAHGLTNIGLLLIFPHFVGNQTLIQFFESVWIWLGF